MSTYIEPGGFLQWDEVDLGAFKALPPNPTVANVASKQLIAYLHEYMESLGYNFT